MANMISAMISCSPNNEKVYEKSLKYTLVADAALCVTGLILGILGAHSIIGLPNEVTGLFIGLGCITGLSGMSGLATDKIYPYLQDLETEPDTKIELEPRFKDYGSIQF